MKGLLLKDFYVTTKQLKIFMIIIPVIALVGMSSMSVMAILLGAVLPMTAIAYDERSKWNELAAMMPYSKRDLIISKYLLGYICMSGSAVLVILGRVISSVLSQQSLNIDWETILIAVCTSLVFIALNTPILFKFGTEKGRIVFMLAIVLASIFGGFVSDSGIPELSGLKSISPLLVLPVVLLLNIISIQISMRIKPSEG